MNKQIVKTRCVRC